MCFSRDYTARTKSEKLNTHKLSSFTPNKHDDSLPCVPCVPCVLCVLRAQMTSTATNDLVPLFVILSCLVSTCLVLCRKERINDVFNILRAAILCHCRCCGNYGHLQMLKESAINQSRSRRRKSSLGSNKNNVRVRYAEKSRDATCSFADRVARLVLEKYDVSCPRELKLSYKQTVVAGFLIEDAVTGTLECVAVGVGTKYLSSTFIQSDPNGERVRDSHAEILARRSLQHYMYTQLERAQRGQESMFVRRQRSTRSENHADVMMSCHPFTLCDNIFVHFYSSSVPCGNASIKRWAHPKRPTCYDMPPTKYPKEQHPPFHIMQPDQGQVAMLVKRDGGTLSHEELSHACHPHIIAPGTAPVCCGLGCTKTCSDKIAVWNAVGVQGCLLSCLVEPIYLTTCTIGRKFSLKTCQRALCCRMSGFVSDDQVYQVHHPSMLQSSVKFDSSMVRDTDIKSISEQFSGAMFLEPRCFWWASNGTMPSGGSSGVINGSTGLVPHDDADHHQQSSITEVCRQNFLKRFRNAWLTHVQQSSEDMCSAAELNEVLNSTCAETKALCGAFMFTTYPAAKLKLMNNFFKMTLK